MNMKKNISINYKRIAFFILMMLVGMTMFIVPSFAAVKANDVMGNLISLMCSMFKFVGGAIFVWAVIQFILATKRSDADSKADAIQTAVCGIALMGVAAVAKTMGIGSDIATDITDTTFGGGGSEEGGGDGAETEGKKEQL